MQKALHAINFVANEIAVLADHLFPCVPSDACGGRDARLSLVALKAEYTRPKACRVYANTNKTNASPNGHARRHTGCVARGLSRFRATLIYFSNEID